MYVLDEPSAGLHPADTEALLGVLDRLRGAGNSLLVVEHEVDVIRHADWLVDVGPGAGAHGGRVLYSGPPAGLAQVADSVTARYLDPVAPAPRAPRRPTGAIELRGVTHHNLSGVDVDVPLGVFTAVTGVSGSGKTTLVTGVLAAAVRERLGARRDDDGRRGRRGLPTTTARAARSGSPAWRRSTGSSRSTSDPIGRTPRSNLATYTGLFDGVRKLFADTDEARRRGYRAGPVLVQRRRRPLRELPGRGLRRRRAAVPARHVLAVPGVRRRALQPGDPRGALPRPVDRRRPRA